VCVCVRESEREREKERERERVSVCVGERNVGLTLTSRRDWLRVYFTHESATLGKQPLVGNDKAPPHN
jgi:hypothetical protein